MTTGAYGPQLVIHGQLANELIVKSATTIWATAGKDVMLRIEIPDAGRSQFTAGGTASNYLTCEETKFCFLRNDQPVLPADWPSLGVGEFAIHCTCHLDRSSNKKEGPLLKYVMHLVLMSVGELRRLKSAMSSNA